MDATCADQPAEVGSFEGGFDVADQFRRWSLAAQFAVGREMPVAARVPRADLRWSEGVADQQFAARSTQRTRAAQLAISFLG